MQERLLDDIRAKRPVVHCITNQVTVNYVINTLMGLGAMGVSTNAPQESADITAKSDALVLNVGTLTDSLADSMIVAGRRANEMGIPVVLDPDGAAFSNFRKDIVNEVLNNVAVTCIRGNASDIAALLDMELENGAAPDFDDLQILSDRYQTAVVMTGSEDRIVYRASQARILNDIPMMRRISGNGAALSAVIAAFLSVSDITNPFDAIVTAASAYSTAGQMSEQNYAAVGSASFAAGIIDALSIVSAADLTKNIKLEIR
ncbi:MAG: hydroxyethylthiazole kinase [Lachnospiraceae bacterium]|nr:hydroxyethylthiazole kinase [Lachnospiraceae bacterium]MDN4742463.1 hydroxyethylthiazole kinase [Lachnospiraceae bacterium C1.1]